MSAMVGVFARACTQVSGSVVSTLAAPRTATSSVSRVLWEWWDERATSTTAAATGSAKVREVAVKSSIAAATARRIAGAVSAHVSGAAVARVASPGDAGSDGCDATVAACPGTPTSQRPASHAEHRRACSPCGSWGIFCQRRRSKARESAAFYSTPARADAASGGTTESAAPSTAVVPATGAMTAQAQSTDHTGERMVVYLKKRQVYGTEWARALTLLGQDHVGVVVAPFDSVRASGGSVPISLENVHRVAGDDSVAFDFGPVDGKDFSIFKICDAEIRRGKFDDGQSAVVATTHRSMADIERFNANYSSTYHLGTSDCRDYASALLQYLTGVKIQPSDLVPYINWSRHHAEALRTETTAGTDDATPSKPSKWCLGLGDMRSIITGAGAPFHLSLGL